MKLQLNSVEYKIDTVAGFSDFLDQIDSTEKVEAWIVSTEEKSLCLLKNVNDVLLMYLRYPGDVGFVSGTPDVDSKMKEFLLSNGQADEYPLSWCIEKELAYKAMEHFFVNAGEQYPYITWHVVYLRKYLIQ